MKLLRSLFQRTLNSVYFGILLMASIAIYIAVGSGVPEVREFFEMDEIAFFNTWVFGGLLAVFAVNMIVVTVMRIPLTPPRYGVWTVHLGIILLIASMASYFWQKYEGLAFIPMKSGTAWFYDRWERSLYARVIFTDRPGDPPRNSMPMRLGSLPRFGEYSKDHQNHSRLDRRDLQNLVPMLRDFAGQANGADSVKTLQDMVGAAHPVSIDIVEYYPYAQVKRWGVADESTPATTPRQVAIVMRDTQERSPEPIYLMSDGPASDSRISMGQLQFEHRQVPSLEDARMLAGSVERLHRLSVQFGEFNTDMFVQPGRSYPLGSSGYTLKIEAFWRNWQAIDGKSTQALSMLVERDTPPQDQPAVYRRMVLNDRDTQTDFKLEASGGPMGVRQSTPLDPELFVRYRHADPVDLAPKITSNRVVFVTNQQDKTVIALSTDMHQAARVDQFDFSKPGAETGRIVASAAANEMAPNRTQVLSFDFALVQNVVRDERILVVPEEERDSEVGQAGSSQVVKVRVSSGDFSEYVYVPFSQFAGERAWPERQIVIPGAASPFYLQLSNTRWRMPVRVQLDRFEAMPFAGGQVGPGSLMRDFKSHLILTELDRFGEPIQATASLNYPAFYSRPLAGFLPGESWIFYQAQWDPVGQSFTILGVANRPAIRTMAFSCVLIAIGLLYAFYIKPVIVNRMKKKALEEAQRRRSLAQGTNGFGNRTSLHDASLLN
jgi:hypothetical protein